MRELVIHVAMATDKNYIGQTMVAIKSIISRKNASSRYCFHLLADNVLEEDKEAFKKEFDNNYKDDLLDIICIDGMIEGARQMFHISPTTCSRLLLPEILSEIKRCLWLDSDVIVMDDVESIYWMDFNDKLVFGVKALPYHLMSGEAKDNYQAVTGIKKMNQYVNAGVLLMNLEEMRKESFCDKALPLVAEHLPSQDQDIINKICYNRIGFLSPKYNFAPKWIEDINSRDCDSVFSPKEVTEALTQPCIVHYCDGVKPWDFPESILAEKWWSVCKKSAWFSFFYQKAENAFYYAVMNQKDALWNIKQNSKEWLEEIKKQERIYIYGFGKNAKNKVDELTSLGVKIKGILVSEDGNLTPDNYNGIPIRHFPTNVEEDAIILVATRKVHYKEIRDLLYTHGIGKILYSSQL
ncbi:MAG: glycosyltransferase family 8 protein [Lachnospiraceae bacterium]|nr:glycosyltransferase family 8 protein [Lachnospiraceae bacterium]